MTIINIFELPAALRKEIRISLRVIKLDLELSSDAPAFSIAGQLFQ